MLSGQNKNWPGSGIQSDPRNQSMHSRLPKSLNDINARLQMKRCVHLGWSHLTAQDFSTIFSAVTQRTLFLFVCLGGFVFYGI